MRNLHAFVASRNSIASRALIGAMTMALLSAQTFGQNPSAPNQSSSNTNPSPVTASSSDAANPAPAATNGNAAALPDAPSAAGSLAANAMPASPAEDGTALLTPPRTRQHHVRPGFLVMGILGATAAGMGAYIFSLKTSRTGARDALGTMFLAPGAAAGGLGFYFAFKK